MMLSLVFKLSSCSHHHPGIVPRAVTTFDCPGLVLPFIPERCNEAPETHSDQDACDRGGHEPCEGLTQSEWKAEDGKVCWELVRAGAIEAAECGGGQEWPQLRHLVGIERGICLFLSQRNGYRLARVSRKPEDVPYHAVRWILSPFAHEKERVYVCWALAVTCSSCVQPGALLVTVASSSACFVCFRVDEKKGARMNIVVLKRKA